MANEETRPVRMCDSCGGVDDHPRHVFSQASGDGATSDEIAELALRNSGDSYSEILRQVRDDSVIQKHMDCCADDGCPDGACHVVVALADGAQGDELVTILTNQTPEA